MKFYYCISIKRGKRITSTRDPFEYEKAIYLPAGTTRRQANKRLELEKSKHRDADVVELEISYEEDK